jgi:hypothetical protein
MRAIVWTIKDIAEILKKRTENQFDANFLVSGDRGNGKSTLTSELFYRCGKFKPWKQQVYCREEVIKLLKTQFKGNCFDDEAINSGYKRNFQDKGQQELIRIITAYRDHFNIYGSAIPNFYSLDKDLRDLIFLHLHVIERGIAVVHMPLQGLLYSQDRWDTKNNAKKEQTWTEKIKKDPTFKPRYHQLSTFRGYLYFNDLTEKQKKLYLEIKQVKRKPAFDNSEDEKEETFLEKVYRFLLSGKLTNEGLMQMCLMEGTKYSNVLGSLARKLKDSGEKRTPKDFLITEAKAENTKHLDGIKNLVPKI